MPDQPDTLVRIEPTAADTGKYMVYSRLEIVAILLRLQKTGSMITAYFGDDRDFILTSVLAVRPGKNELILDYGADEAANQRAPRAIKITFAAVLDRIKIQFAAASMKHVRFEARDAFSLSLPDELLRLQRREFFRIPTPLTRPLKCMVLLDGRAPRETKEVNVIDISCGGIAIIDSLQSPYFDTGTSHQGCSIDLPELGAVTTDLMVRNAFEVTLLNGAKHRHAGCEFIAMTEPERAKIQRYINRMERERKDRSGRH